MYQSHWHSRSLVGVSQSWHCRSCFWHQISYNVSNCLTRLLFDYLVWTFRLVVAIYFPDCLDATHLIFMAAINPPGKLEPFQAKEGLCSQ